MENVTNIILNKDTPVAYDDAKHLYSAAGRRYVSASQLVEKFVNPFDSPEVAKRYAEKHGMTAEYWLNQWATKNEKSKIRGNHIHDTNELILQAKMIDRFNDHQLTVHADAVTEEDPWITRPDGIYTERKIWHHGYRIAGRADKIILLSMPNFAESTTYETRTIRYAHIEDYKTNERLDFESYQFRNSSRKMMKPPLGHVMDCNIWHYYLQLSTYMFMLEYQGFTPGTMTIIHYPHPSADNPNPKPIRYNVPYLKKEVLMMVKFINR